MTCDKVTRTSGVYLCPAPGVTTTGGDLWWPEPLARTVVVVLSRRSSPRLDHAVAASRPVYGRETTANTPKYRAWWRPPGAADRDYNNTCQQSLSCLAVTCQPTRPTSIELLELLA